MKIGISGPILINSFKQYLENKELAKASGVKGLGGTAINTLAQGLIERGEYVSLFSLDPTINEEIILSGPNMRIFLGPYRPRARDRALDFFQAERNYIKNVILQEKPDIVHAHWTYEFALGALASGVPTIVTVRDWSPEILVHCQNLNHFIYRFIRYLMDRKTFQDGSWFSANSITIQERIKRRWNIKVPIIPNSIEESSLRKENKPFPVGAPRIISIGNGFSALKNQQLLFRAFPLIRRTIPNCILVFAGSDFEPGGAAEQWAKKQSLNDGIIYLGFLERADVISVLDESSLMIHPSLEESFGNVLLEAMARRVPVLGGEKSGAVPWILDYGKAGVLCDVCSADAIAQNAIEILTSRSYWTKLSERGYERVRDTFSLSKVVDLCLLEYQRILNEEKK